MFTLKKIIFGRNKKSYIHWQFYSVLTFHTWIFRHFFFSFADPDLQGVSAILELDGSEKKHPELNRQYYKKSQNIKGF